MQLIVLDDESEIAHYLATLASLRGWNATAISMPEELFNANFETHAVLVLDLLMPQMDGIEVIRKLSEKKSTFR